MDTSTASFQGIQWISANAWAYPVLEILHIAGIALMLGSLVLVELRVWGYAPELPAQALARAGLRLTLGGFGLVAFSGLLMFSAHPSEMLSNQAFVLKMALLALAGLNAALFHVRESMDKADAMARVQTALSLGLWLAIIICGRWIAYL